MIDSFGFEFNSNGFFSPTLYTGNLRLGWEQLNMGSEREVPTFPPVS